MEVRHTVMFWCYLELLCGGKTYSDVLVIGYVLGFLSYCVEGRHTVMFCYLELLCGCKKYSDVLVLC